MDEIYRALFAESNDALFVLDLETSAILQANQAFADLTGYPLDEVAGGGLTAQRLVHPSNLALLEGKRAQRRQVIQERFEIQIRTRDGEQRPVELSVRWVRLGKQELVFGSMRDVTRQKQLERRLMSEINRQRDLTFKAAQASVRIGQVLEKVRNVPILTRDLMRAGTVSELLEVATQTLTQGGGFHYERAVVYRAPEEGGPPVILADGGSAWAASREEKALVEEVMRCGEASKSGSMYGVPMRSRRGLDGAFVVHFNPMEKTLFDDNETVREAQEDTVKTLGNLLGLAMETLDLATRLREQSVRDQLTGVHNRRYLDLCLDRHLDAAEARDGQMSLAMFDVDRFKSVNDTWGHQRGDDVLVGVARVLEEAFPDALALCRYGGDEFVVLLAATVEETGRRAEAARAALARESWNADRQPSVTVSVGVSGYRECRDTREFLKAADDALYSAKERGRDRVEYAGS